MQIAGMNVLALALLISAYTVNVVIYTRVLYTFNVHIKHTPINAHAYAIITFLLYEIAISVKFPVPHRIVLTHSKFLLFRKSVNVIYFTAPPTFATGVPSNSSTLRLGSCNWHICIVVTISTVPSIYPVDVM